MSSRGLSPSLRHWVILLRIFAAESKDVAFRCHLTLSLSRNLLHELDDAAEHGLTLIELIFLLLSAYEDEL